MAPPRCSSTGSSCGSLALTLNRQRSSRQSRSIAAALKLLRTCAALLAAIAARWFINKKLVGASKVERSLHGAREERGPSVDECLDAERQKAISELKQVSAVTRASEARGESDCSLAFNAWSRARSLQCDIEPALHEELKALVRTDLQVCVDKSDHEEFRDGRLLSQALTRADRMGLRAETEPALERAVALRDDNMARGRKALAKTAELMKAQLPLICLGSALHVITGLMNTATLPKLSDIINALCSHPKPDEPTLGQLFMNLLCHFGRIAVLQQTCSLLDSYFKQFFIRNLVDRLHLNVFSQEQAFWDQSRSKELAEFVTDSAVKTLVRSAEFIPATVSACAKIFMLAYTMFSKSARLALMLLVGVPSLIPLHVQGTKANAKLQESLDFRKTTMKLSIQETFDSFSVVRAFGSEVHEVQRMAQEESSIKKLALQIEWRQEMTLGAVKGALFVFMTAMIWYGGALVRNGRLRGGDLVMFFYQFWAVWNEVTILGTTFERGGTLGNELRQVLHLMNRESEMPLDKGLTPEQPLKGHLEFRDVTFAYPATPGVPILRGLSFECEAGRTTAFVGATGCGKTTILKLATRLYDPSSGAVLVDGVDARGYSPAWLRKQIGIVNQEPVLFSTTIYENVKYGKPDASDEEVERALRDAQIWEELHTSSFPHRLLTSVGEAQKAKISAGQKQRIAIARALLCQPPVLVLDEGTSALDGCTERRVQEAIKVASANRTVLVVAHRLSTVSHANICMLEKPKEGGPARIVETGRHEDLLAAQGPYADLVKHQTWLDAGELNDPRVPVEA